jgi:hypothetical protein
MLAGLDHIILGANDLGRGIDWVEERTGVRAALGGVHPGRGTQNALVALGADCYLEIIAPDPSQPFVTWFTQINSITQPKLLTWAAHTSDLDALAQRVRAEGLAIDGPHQGKRTRPDSKVLSWRLFHLRNNYGGLLPFFIEWNPNSVHPATDAPAGCTLDRFELQSPHAQELARVCRILGVEVPIVLGSRSLIRARIRSPKGLVDLAS